MHSLKIRSIKKLNEQIQVCDVSHKIDFTSFIDDQPNLIVNGIVIANCGKHAGGVLVMDDANKNLPLIKAQKEVRCPWTEGVKRKDLSTLGYVKFDLLGLETLRIIQRCIELIMQRHEGVEAPTPEDVKNWYNEKLHPDKLDLEDQRVYENVFHAGRFAATFQFTSKPTQGFIKRFKPRSILDLAAATSIWRPGPLAGNVHELYLEARAKVERGEEIEYDHPIIKETLQNTFGYMLYQESIMLIANKLAGMSLDDCDKLRKALLKRTVTGNEKNMGQVDELELAFIEGCVKNGYVRNKAEKLYAEMKSWSSYGFNKCIYNKTLVQTVVENNIVNKQICDIVPGEKVLSRDETTGKNIAVEVKNVYNTGKKRTYKFVLSDGREIRCTKDHKFRTKCGKMLPIHQIMEMDLEIL